MPAKVKKAVIPAAGLGTRFLPATKIIAKEMLPIVDKPCIQYIVEEAKQAGIEEIIFVISKGKESIMDQFRSHVELENQLQAKNKTAAYEAITALNDQLKYSVVYQDQPLGLGHAVNCAREAVGDEWFFVFLPDDIIDHDPGCALQMQNSWETHQAAMIAVMEVPWDNVHQYGVVKALPMDTRLGKIESVVEKPKREDAPSNLAIIGRYLLPPEIFTLLGQTKPGAIGEIQLTDALLALISQKDLYAFQFEGERFDAGNKLGFLEANIHFGIKDAEVGNRIQELVRIFAESR